jgi:hypothetical protein
MRRRTFDLLMSTGGIVVTVVMLVASALLFVGYSYANNNVHSQLSAQKIFFPPAGSESITSLPASDRPFIAQYAGQQMVDGAQAKAYADHFIAVHLKGIGGGKTYSELSLESLQKPDDAALAAQVQTVFRGETLRGLLLNAFAFWKLGQIAKLASIITFVLALMMGLLTIMGFWHLRRVSPTVELAAPPIELKEAASA